MAIEAQLPDGRILEFPDGTDPEVIQSAAKRLMVSPLSHVSTEELKNAPSAPFLVSDIARSGGTGVVGGLGSLAAVGGANSAPSKYLDEKTQGIQSGLSPARLAEMQRREEIMRRAEESGSTWEKIKAGVGAVTEAPLQSLAQGLGSAVSPVAAAAAAVALAPEALAAGIGIAAAAFVGGLMGAGESKKEINDRVKREFEKAGDAPDVAARKADEAQAWTGQNLDQIMINAGAGALEGATGVGRYAAGAARTARGLKPLPTKPLTAPTKLGTVAGAAAEEAAPEFIQSLAGTAAGNVAASRAGFQTDTFEGATSAAVRDALIGALTGAAVSPVQYRGLQNDFLRQQQDEANKKQEEFRKQREEFVQKYQQQQEETKKNLGLNMLALPAPAKTAEEKYRNPAATITKEEMGDEASKYVDDYRKANNLPKLKAYSIEDIQDAMPGLNPEGEKGILDSILAGKYGYKPVDETTGNEIKYTSDDIMALAEEEKNIATGTQGFKDFLTSVTGTDKVGEMSQPQLHAAYSALQKFEPSEETRILPEGTAATRFSQKQYDNALKVVNVEFASVDNKPLDPKVIAKEIKESTGLENDRDALALLDTAVKNGDLTFSTKPVFRVVDPATGQFVHTALTRAKAEKFAEGKNLNIIGDSQSYISPAEQDTLPDRTPLPAGYQINQERVVEGEQDLVDVMREGKGQPLETIAVDKAQERIDTLTGDSKALADRALKRIEQDSATTQKIQKNLDQRIAKGEGKTRDFEIQKTRSEQAITNLRKRIQKNLDKIEELSAPIKTRKSEVKKPIIKKKLTVTKDGKAIGTFSQDEIGKANAQAQDAILTQMTDEEIQAAIDDKKLGLFSKKAKEEQDRRRGPTGFKITKAKTPETLSPEFVDQAEEIKKRLMPILQRFGLGNVGLNIVKAIKNNAEGSYLNSLIQVAFPDPSDPNATKPVQTMRHEALHALRDLGFFTDSQWQALTNKAKSEWIGKYLKGQNVEVDGKVMSRYDGYVYINQTEPAAWNKANPDKPAREVMSDAALNELLIEEAIADAFGDFDANGSPAGMMAAILKRLNQFFEALRNAITGAGFQTAEDIFGKVERGELKGTKEATSEEKASLRIPLSTRAIMEQNDAFAQNELGLTNNPVFLTYDPKTSQVVSAHKKLEAAQARAKKDNLEIRRGFENNVRDVAIVLNNETKTQYGVMDQKTLGSADSDVLAKAMADEVGYQLRAMSKTGTGQGWYSNNYPNAVKRLAKRFPELGNNKHARSVFSALVAITSNGEDVSTNISNAIYYYSKLRMGKRLVALGSRRATALENNLQQLEDLLKTYGKDFEKILMEEITVKDMNAYLRSIGEKTSSDYLAATVIPKAAIYFGPKLGAFYANLSGSEGYLTMDLWWTRTMNRMRGLLLPEATKSSIDSFREMIGEPNASKEKIVELTIPLRNKYEDFGWNTELEHLVGAKEPSTNADKPKWNRRAEKLAGDAYEQLMFDHKLEKMANTIYKNEFETLEEAPFSPSDRKFMYDAARKTQSLLRKEGINLSLADIQAALWYYEKRLYAKLKGGKPDDIGYEEAIIENANKASGRERPSVVFPEQPNGGDVSQAEVADSDAIGGSSASGEEKYSLRGIIAEVAPHPDQEVVNKWREMTPSERLAATTNVANKTMRRIFDELGFSGYTYKFSTGKYEGEQNPNILVEAPDDASIEDLNKLARVMGFVFDQKAMIAYDESNTTSDDQGSFVKVIVPEDMSPTDLNKLRDLIGTTVPQAEGDTLRDGALIFGNFSAFNDNIKTLDDKQFRKALADAVESFDYDGVIQVSEPETFHSQYIWPGNRDEYLEGTEYGNGRDIQGEEGADVRGGRRSRLQTIADEAISLRDRWIDSRGAARIGSGTKFDKVAVPEPTAEYGEPTEGSVSAVGVHFSKQPRSTLVSSMYGTGLKGAEFERLIDAPDIRPRIYFYVDKGNGIRPEAGVGGSPHVIRLNNLYDASSDSKGIIKNNTGTTLGEQLNNLERSIIEAGYDGYLNKDPLLNQGFAVLVGKHNIETKVKLSLRKAPDTPTFKRWFGDSKAVDANGSPQVMYHGTRGDFSEFRAGLIFASPSPMVANKFAANDMLYSPEKPGIEPGANVMPVYVKASNPFDYENPEHVNELFEAIKTRFASPSRAAAKRLLSEGQFKIIEESVDTIKELGFDSLYVEEFGEKNLAVFEPNQVKSATGNQGTFDINEPDIRLSLRSTRQPPESKEFKQWFGNSYFTSNGEPLIMYHGTARDITIFKGKQAKAIFVTTEPKVAETYADMGVDYMRTEAYKALTRDEKVELITVVAEQAERDGTITKAELKEIQSNLKKRVPPIDSEKNRILDLPYQIEGEIIESLNNLLPTKGNIMPVYVNARNIFDYANKDHVNQVYNWMMNNSRALGRMQNPEDWLKSVKGLISRGNWVRIESEDVQEAIRALDFDGFSVLEAGSKNYAVYNATNIKSVTGNIGTFGLGEVTSEQAKQFGMTAEQAKQAQEEGDIRFSLRKAPDTPEFKRWFGKSKVVNEDGTPKVMYHGTNKDFNEFMQSAEKANRTGMPDGFYFTSDFKDASNYAKGEGANVMPVYLSIKNPFNLNKKNKISNEMVMQFRDELRADNPNLAFDWIQSKVKIFKENTAEGSFPFPNISFPTAAMQRVFEVGGYDGLIDGDRVFVAFKQSQVKSATGNVGTYDPNNPDIRFSLKSQVAPKIVSSIEKTTTVREEKGFAERMMDAISPKGFSSWRAEAVNRYNALSIVDKMKVQKSGGAALYADQSAEAMALLSDDAAGVAASAMGVHDRHGGIPVYRNGITTIDDSVEGILPIFAPLAKYKDPFVYQMYQFYSGAKRARRYLDKGIEKNYDANDIAYAEQLGKQYPEFEQIFKKWDKYNKGLVKYQVDTGVLSAAEGAEYIKYSDYVPFYRQLEGENTFGPNVFQSISGVKKGKKYKGGEAPIADFMETIVRNTQSAIQAGMKNTAAKVAVNNFMDIGQAEAAPDGSTGEEFVHVLEGGVKKSYLVYDKALVQAVMSLNLPDLPFIGFFAGPANLLRNLVTKDPGFMLANMVRDSMSAWVTSGVNMTPVASAAKNFVGALRGTSPEYKALLNAGILGGYEYSQGVEVSAANMKKALGRYEPSTGLNKLKDAPRSLWEALEKGTMASDAATRIEVYKNVLAETGNEAEALFRAQEVMNFQRKGRSAVVRVLTAGIPFLNARIQGLDVLYRSMSGQMGTVDAKKIQKAFFVRGSYIMAMSMIYWFLTHDEEEYKKQEQETRDNNWLIPSLGIKLPIPFEVGVIFKVIPERIAEYFFGNDTGKDFADSMKRNFMSTFAFNLIPQVGLPLYEAATNHSFFTGRDIVGAGLKGVKSEYQVGPGTSQLAAWLGSQTGYSPMLIDHVIGGYTGTFGSYAVDAIDSIAFANSDVQRPSKRFEQLPIFKRFLLDPQAKGNVTAYYDLKNSVDEAVRTSNFLEKTSNFEEMGKYNEEALKVLASKDFISDMEKDMKELREMSLFVRTSTLSPDDKRDMLMSITDAENAMTANVKYLRKLMD